MSNSAIGHPHQWYGGHSYAQHGDDFAIINIFKRLEIEKPTYLDIGAHHPWELSNTALLHQRGSRGINVDANEKAIRQFNQVRPEDVNVWAAVLHPRDIGQIAETTLFVLNETSGLNTTVEGSLPGSIKRVTVPAHSINYIVHHYGNGVWPDLLSIDAEGRDLDILDSIPWINLKSSEMPKVVCVEAASPAGNYTTQIRHLMTKAGYYVHSWCGSNMLFVQIALKHLLH